MFELNMHEKNSVPLSLWLWIYSQIAAEMKLQYIRAITKKSFSYLATNVLTI